MASPAGVWRHAQSRPLQVDAEPALRTVGRAVAVARLAVADVVVASQQPGERKIVTCKKY